MRTARSAVRSPLVVAILLGAATAIAALLMVWASPAEAKDSQKQKRDYSHTIYGSDSEKEIGAAEVGATAISPTNNASSIASAITRDASFITGASFTAIPPSGQPNAVSNSALTGFPRHGSNYSILTTGSAALADDANSSGESGADDGGGNVRGDTDFDVSILKVDLSVPSSTNCLSVDFRFLSEEYPEWVGSSFNDAFIAELDNSTWTTSGTTISAPNNFAFDENGEEISINSTGTTSVSAANASGTTYDAATQRLQARTPITPGAHSLYLSIFDQGDEIYDSAVFLDSLNLYSAPSADCQEGAQGGPIIVATSPEAGATEASRVDDVTATFSKAMNPNTLTTSTIQMKVGKKKVPVGISCDSPCRTVTLNPYPTDPSRPLAANKKHKVVIKGGSIGVKDSDGNPMEQTAIWTFTTEST